MIYRVVLSVSYHEVYFDFDGIESAVMFATTMLEHQVESEDCKKKRKLQIEIINPNVKVDEEEEE